MIEITAITLIEENLHLVDAKWEIFRISVCSQVFERLQEFFQERQTARAQVNTTLMLNKAQHEGTGRYVVAISGSTELAVQFKLAFDCEHFNQSWLPHLYHYDLQVDPRTPIQMYVNNPIRAQQEGWF